MISNNPNFGIYTGLGFKSVTVKVSNNVITGYTSDVVINPTISTNINGNNCLVFNFNKDCI